MVPPYLAALAITVLADAWLYRRGWLRPLVGTLHGSPLQPRVLAAAVLEIVPGFPAARISGQDFSFVPFAWTLRVEFAFYFAMFGASWLAGRPAMARVPVMAGVLAAGYLAFAVFVWRGGNGALQVICVPFFAFGVGVFVVDRWRNVAGAGQAMLALACALWAFPYFRQHGHPIMAFQLGLMVALFGTIFALSRIGNLPARVRRWDRRLGELSYPLYISHGVVLTVLGSLVTTRGVVPYGGAIVLAILLAAGLHVVVEQPLRSVRTRLRGVAV